jgi:hypothetical protein
MRDDLISMRDQRADADNRVIDVLWKSEFGANFCLGFAVVTIRCSKARESGTVSISHTITCGMVRRVSYRSRRLRTFIPRVIYRHKSATTIRTLNESDDNIGVPMTTASQTSFNLGTKCVQCDNELIAPEWSEYRSKRQNRHHWRCSKCDCCFETVVDTTVMEDPMIGGEIFASRLVA